MRLVFVQHAGTRVCGSWVAERVSRGALLEENALAVARGLDEDMGKPGRRYEFAPFGPEGPCDGYDVFCCIGDGDDDQAVGEEFSAVVCLCQYVGYVASVSCAKFPGD
jgi:hypothetical protein